MPKLVRQSKPVAPPSRWHPGEVRLSMRVAKKELQEKVVAECLHPFAVHPARLRKVEGSGWYTLTHIPSGLALTSVRQLEDAKRIGETLLSSRYGCLRAWRHTNGDRLAKELPSWVKPWLRACREKGCFVSDGLPE